MSNEIEWRDIPGYGGFYRVSNTGLVKSMPRVVIRKNGKPLTIKERIIGESVATSGYPAATLSANDMPKSIYVHALVALAFIGKRPAGLFINHKNGVRTDNRIENLEYCTPLENVRHSIDVLGNKPFQNFDRTLNRGEKHSGAKLNNEQVREIRRLNASGMTARELSKKYQIEVSHMFRIIRRDVWKHID